MCLLVQNIFNLKRSQNTSVEKGKFKNKKLLLFFGGGMREAMAQEPVQNVKKKRKRSLTEPQSGNLKAKAVCSSQTTHLLCRLLFLGFRRQLLRFGVLQQVMNTKYESDNSRYGSPNLCLKQAKVPFSQKNQYVRYSCFTKEIELCRKQKTSPNNPQSFTYSTGEVFGLYPSVLNSRN